MADDTPVCGHPTNRRDGSPCQRRVARDGLRCPHHPSTPDEGDREPVPVPVRGWWPSAEAVAVISDPVRPLAAAGAGEVSGDHAE